MDADHALPWRTTLEGTEVLERFRWARHQGHPAYHWPDVPPAAWQHAVGELERVAGAVLRGVDVRLEAPDTMRLRALGVAGYTSGLGPLVGYWLTSGQVEAPAEVRRLFGLHLAHGRARAARLRAELGRAVEALGGTGAAPLVVKAAHTGAAYFPEPGTRPALDVDLVVTPAGFAAAEAALAGAGFTLGAREHRPPKSTWLAPGASRLPRSLELLHADSQYAIDLHASLERNFFGVRRLLPDVSGPLPTRAASELGQGARVLRQPGLLVYHALHGSEGFFNLTLVRMVELVLMIRQDVESGALDWDEAAALLRALGAARFAYPALAMAERLVPGTLEPRFLASLTSAATPRMRQVVAARTPASAQRLDVLSVRERFMWCQTPGDYLRRVLHMAAPPPAGGSPRRLGRMYAERAFRLLRGRARR
jgi:hypothetical protein